MLPAWPYTNEAQDFPDEPVDPWQEPTRVTSGDTITWSRSLGNYPAQQGWVLKYSFRDGQGTSLDVQSAPAAAGSNDHTVTITPAVSGTLVAGRYVLAGYAVGANGERHTIFEGFIVVRPNLATADPGLDLRSHAQRMVTLIEAVLEGRATNDVLESEIEGTKIARIPPRDLMLIRDRYLGELISQERLARARNGKATGRAIFARFTPAGR